MKRLNHKSACTSTFGGTDTPQRRTPHDITDNSDSPNRFSIAPETLHLATPYNRTVIHPQFYSQVGTIYAGESTSSYHGYSHPIAHLLLVGV